MFPAIIAGDKHIDNRGRVNFVNDFDMHMIRRMYSIENLDASVIRAWQGHKIENKWFYVAKGSFEVKVLEIDNFENPSSDLICQSFILSSDVPAVLHVPEGCANGFRSLNDNSVLMVYSNLTLAQSKSDDYRYPINQWNVWLD